MPIRPVKPQGTTQAHTIMPPVRSRTRPVMQGKGNPPAPEVTEPQQTKEEAGYAVGYGKPPVATRFKPGQSGNSKGRPKAAKGLGTIVRDTMTQKVAVRTPSGEKRISRIEAALHKTVELAMKGNPRALGQLIKLYADAVPEAKSCVDAPELAEDLTATDVAILEELRLMLLAEQARQR
jgi:hypothetical protein